jgi:hypothetical protein
LSRHATQELANRHCWFRSHLSLGFYLYFLSIASKSNDPVALMQTVGTVPGAVGGLSIAMIIIGLIGKKI